MTDEDLPKAQYALLVLREARLARHDAAAKMVRDLANQTANTGLRTPEIEDAHEAAWIAIVALAGSLNESPFTSREIWNAAFKATESWHELLT